MFGEYPQASGDLYDDSADSDVDGFNRQNHGRVTFGSCFGIETN